MKYLCLIYCKNRRDLSSHLPPVHTDGQEGEHVEGDRHVGDVVVDPAVNGAKDPDSEIEFDVPGDRERGRGRDSPVPHEYKAWYTVESAHQEVGQGEIDKEVVGDAPHTPVC